MAAQRRPRSRLSKILAVIAALVSASIVVVSVAGYLFYRHLDSNISIISTEGRLGVERPQKVASVDALNLLLIGSDTRSGNNDFVGGQSAGLSDTTIVLHISANRKWATAVSIPRDTMVQMPTCVENNGKVRAAGLRQFNESYAIGGAPCVQTTVEHMTGIRIDHFLVVDFAGFRSMVDAIGGVKVDIPTKVDDNVGHIHFAAGCQTLNGTQSLQYVRLRHIGSGSDPDRILRQQAFLSSVIQRVSSLGVLLDPTKLLPFLDASTKSISTDPGLGSVTQLAARATSLKSIGLPHISFITAPWRLYPPDHNRLQLSGKATVLWNDLAHDVEAAVADNTADGATTPTATPTATPTGTATASGKPTPTFKARAASDKICS